MENKIYFYSLHNKLIIYIKQESKNATASRVAENNSTDLSGIPAKNPFQPSIEDSLNFVSSMRGKSY